MIRGSRPTGTPSPVTWAGSCDNGTTMPISRRVFVTGSLTGAGVLALSACSSPSPAPTASSPAPTGTPTPTATTASGVTPAAFRRSSWGDDPYAYGSNSVLTTESTSADRETLRASLDDKVFFAGEAVAETWPGTVTGARLSGIAVAAEVAAVAAPGERIAVIGAGIAGATAARTLADQGFDVVVIEARQRVGGRIASSQGDDWPIEVQTGVSMLFGDGAADLESLLTSAGVVTVPFEAETTAREGSARTRFPTTATVAATLASARAWADRQSAEVSVDGALDGSGVRSKLSSAPDASGVSDADRLAWVLAEALPARFGADADALSSRALSVGAAPVDAQLVTKGFAAYVAGLLTDLDVLRGSNVTQITYANEGVGLRLVTGESLSADRVVSTIPLGVFKKQRIVFVPEQSAVRRSAIDRLGMGVQDVLWLRFDERIWSTDDTVWAILDDDATYRLWVNLEPATGYPILVALIGGESAVAAEKLSDAEAVAAAVADLAPYLDRVADDASPTPSPTPSS